MHPARLSSHKLGQTSVHAAVRASLSVSAFRFTNRPAGATIRQMGEHDAAQAVELVRALCDLLGKLNRRLVWLEHHGSNMEAAALRRDVHEAQTHINRLESKYLRGDEQRLGPQLARQAL